MAVSEIQQVYNDLCGPAHASAVLLSASVQRLAISSMATTAEAVVTSDHCQLRQQMHQLEIAAAEAHKLAQELNKQGRYHEAAEMYTRMRQLDAEALDVVQNLGCQSCKVSIADREALRHSSDRTSSSPKYQQLHSPTPWPALSDPAIMLERAVGGVVGCLVADAAAMPVQWIYDLEVLDDLLAQRQQAAKTCSAIGLEFYDPVQSPYLPQYKTGRNSPYGEQTLLLLQHLAEQGGLHCGEFAVLYASKFHKFDGYMNASSVAFLRNFARGLQPPATGADDEQADCVARLAPLVAMYAGDQRLMSIVVIATRTTQNTAGAVGWACAGAAVLERLMFGQGPAAAVQQTVDELQEQQHDGRMPMETELAGSLAHHLQTALQLRQRPHQEAVEQLGRNCHMPNALQTPLHSVLHQEWLLEQQGVNIETLDNVQKLHVYVAAVRDALATGGCCASRASYAGACFGMWLGRFAVPEQWLQLYDAAESVQQWAQQVCSLRNMGLSGAGCSVSS